MVRKYEGEIPYSYQYLTTIIQTQTQVSAHLASKYDGR